jgi:hypothetical protein
MRQGRNPLWFGSRHSRQQTCNRANPRCKPGGMSGAMSGAATCALPGHPWAAAGLSAAAFRRYPAGGLLAGWLAGALLLAGGRLATRQALSCSVGKRLVGGRALSYSAGGRFAGYARPATYWAGALPLLIGVARLVERGADRRGVFGQARRG